MNRGSLDRDYQHLKDLMGDPRLYHDAEMRQEARRLLDRLKQAGVRQRELQVIEGELDEMEEGDQPVLNVETEEPTDQANDDDGVESLSEVSEGLAERFYLPATLQSSLLSLLDVMEDGRRSEPRRDRGLGASLVGPPGTGKSELVRAVAQGAGAELREVSGASFSSLMHGPPREFREIYEELAANRPSILLFDEAEGLLASRDNLGGKQDQKRELVAEILKKTSQIPPGMVLVLTVNKPEVVDEAFLRPGRFGDEILYMGLPDRDTRIAVFQDHIGQIPEIPNERAHRLARWLAGETRGRYTPADCVRIVETAREQALQKGYRDVREEVRSVEEFIQIARNSLEGHRSPSVEDFQRALDQTSPSLTADRLRRYRRWASDRGLLSANTRNGRGSP